MVKTGVHGGLALTYVRRVELWLHITPQHSACLNSSFAGIWSFWKFLVTFSGLGTQATGGGLLGPSEPTIRSGPGVMGGCDLR